MLKPIACYCILIEIKKAANAAFFIIIFDGSYFFLSLSGS